MNFQSFILLTLHLLYDVLPRVELYLITSRYKSGGALTFGQFRQLTERPNNKVSSRYISVTYGPLSPKLVYLSIHNEE
jgi:hypothetical protein